MSRRYYRLPPMTRLTAFEVAARKLSFKDAAQELNVTPGAISHQIKALERELNALLFQRKHRGVVLTEAGEHLFEAVAGSFLRVSQTLQHIRENRTNDLVTIGATSAVSSLWLLAMVTSFWRKYPNININQIIQDTPFQSANALDMFIRYGRHADSRLIQTKLYRDKLVPVASPKIAEAFVNCDLSTLSAERLIHLESDDRSWTSWDDWFRQLGYVGQVASGMRVNNYTIALQAAQDGAGIALGWQRLIRPYLKSNQLVMIKPHVLLAPHQFYLVCKPKSQLSEAARIFRQWIIQESNLHSDEFYST